MGATTNQGGTCGYQANGNTSSNTTFTDTANNPFKTTDVGANITIKGAGVAGADLVTTITARASTSSVTLGAAASNTASNQPYIYGAAGGVISSNWTTTITVTLATGQQIGDGICVATNDDPAHANATVADVAGNAYTQRGSTQSNADYHQLIWTAPVSKTMAGGTNKITATYAALENGFSEMGWRHFVGASQFGQVAQGNSSNTNVTAGAFPNIVAAGSAIWFLTGVGQGITSVAAGYTASAISPFSDVEAYQIVGTAGSFTASATQSPTGLYVISAVTMVPTPSSGLPVQQRAPGFPGSGPVPGIALLGQGILVATGPAGVSRTMQAAILGQATLADPMSVARAMTEAVGGRATVTDALVVARALTDAVAGHATLADTLSVSRSFASAIHGQATVSDAMSVARALTVSIAGLASLGFALYRASSGQFLLVNQRAPGFPLGAPLPGIALLGEGILVPVTAAGTARAMQVAIVGRAALAAPLSVTRALADAIHGSATLTDAASVARAMTDAISGHATLADTMAVARPMTDAIHGTATMGDALSVTRALAVAILGHSTITFGDTIVLSLGLTVQGHATLADTLSVARPLTIALHGAGILHADMDINGQIGFAMAIHAGASVGTALAVARAIQDTIAGHASMGATLGRTVGFADHITGVASMAASIVAARGLAAAITGHANVSPHMVLALSLALVLQGRSALTATRSGVMLFVLMPPTTTVSTTMGPTTTLGG